MTSPVATPTDRPPGFYTSGLARFASELRYEDLPAEVKREARLIVLDTLGAMLAAASSRYEAGRLLGGFVEANGGAPQATLLGRGRQTSLVDAALFNGTLAYYCDVEAHHTSAIVHAAAVAVPVGLAICEARGLSGADWLLATVLGIDVAARTSLAIGPNALYARGLHPTSICGAFGGAAAAGRLLGLSPELMANALGLASNQACGLLAWASDHTEQSRPLNPGLAARNGVSAALLAQAGFGAPQNVFDPGEKYNVYRAWSEQGRPEALVERLGERFGIMEQAYKLYSCCAFLHPALDAIMALLDQGVSADEVESIVLRFSHSGKHMIDDNELKSHCAQYILPIGLHNRRIVIDDILQDRRDPRVAALSARTKVVGDDELERFYPERYPSIVELTTRDGRVASQRVDWPKGYPENPVGEAELTAKFLDLASTSIDRPRAERLVELIADLERAPGVGPIVDLVAKTS